MIKQNNEASALTIRLYVVRFVDYNRKMLRPSRQYSLFRYGIVEINYILLYPFYEKPLYV